MKTSYVIAALVIIVLAGVGVYMYRATEGGILPIPGGPEGQVLTAEQKSTCGITASVTEGPYYVSDMPQLFEGNLNFTNLPGDILTRSGHVYEGIDDAKPIANAVIDVWQADNDGAYHPNANGSAAYYSADELALRGYVITDEQGRYSFTTIYPGEYSGRTRHIHVKVRAPEFNEVTTQLIVPSKEGDDITFDEDTVSHGLPRCHLLAIDSAATPASAVFDFRLSR